MAELERVDAGHVAKGQELPIFRAEAIECIAQVDAARPDRAAFLELRPLDLELDHRSPALAAHLLARFVRGNGDEP